MKNDPRLIYPGTNFYGGMTSPFGSSAGMGFNTSPEMAQPIPPSTGLQSAPVAGGLNTPPLSSLFGQSMTTQPPGSGIR
jgi:hypothetical protein